MTTIVLGISPRAAQALERSLRNQPREEGDGALLELITAELASQLSAPTPAAVVTHTTTAQNFAAQMAAAGNTAIKEHTAA